ncbi:MAG: iron export ABC transporter permease subunit FetB [Actinomycetota bacterium]
MTDTGTITGVGLALSAILVALTLLISAWRRLGLERDIVVACIRAAGQLAVVGTALHLVVDDDDPLILSWLWIVVMIAFAANTTQRRVGSDVRVTGLAVGAFGAATGISIAVLFGLQVFELEGRALVPLAGMMVGNSLGATVLVCKRLVAESTEHRSEIEARLSLGLPSTTAFAPHVRRSLRQALIPQIERTKSVGIVFLPGAMVGLILAGVDASDAVLVQAAVMFLVLGSVAMTTTVMAIGVGARLFTGDHRLRMPAGTTP